MRKLLLLLALPLLITTGCAESVGPGDESHVGTYNLSSINGESLPWLFYQDSAVSYELMASEFTLNQDGTYSSSDRWRITQGESVVSEDDIWRGTYTIARGTVAFQGEDGAFVSATLEGDILTIRAGTLVAVYER